MTTKTKRILKIAIPSVWLIALVSTIAYNSTVAPEDRIPFLPVVDISINGRELPPIEVSGTLSGGSLALELKTQGVNATMTNIADRIYAIPTHGTFTELTHWMNRFYWSTPKLRYFPESYDCDNFARTLTVIGDFAFIPSSVSDTPQGQLAIFRIYTKQTYAWGGVPAGGYHALTIVRTSAGWNVHEPQSGAIVELANYPNRSEIMQVIFD